MPNFLLKNVSLWLKECYLITYQCFRELSLLVNTPELTCHVIYELTDAGLRLRWLAAGWYFQSRSCSIKLLLWLRYHPPNLRYELAHLNFLRVRLEKKNLRFCWNPFLSFIYICIYFYNLARALDGMWKQTEPLQQGEFEKLWSNTVCLSTENLNKKLVAVLWGANKWPGFPLWGALGRRR